MTDASRRLAIYLHLARATARRRAPQAHGKLLVLAAQTASESGWDDIAEYCRQRVVAANPQHLLGHYRTMREARSDFNYQHFVRAAARRYSPERAEHLLNTLGIELAREDQLYDTISEYAAALLDTTPDELRQAIPPPVCGDNPFAPTQLNELSPQAQRADLARQPPSAQGHLILLLVPLGLIVVGMVLAALYRLLFSA